MSDNLGLIVAEWKDFTKNELLHRLRLPHSTVGAVGRGLTVDMKQVLS